MLGSRACGFQQRRGSRPPAPGGRRGVVAVRAAVVTQLETGAWVAAPRYRAKGVVHFLGGAFAGAAPQVGGGAVDFYPSPAESRGIISESYGVSPTLVVRFTDDSIDESGEIVRLLKPRLGAGITLLELPGTHLTPCGGDVPWPTGTVFTPADTLVQAVKQTQQADIRRLGRQLVGWMDSVA
ncbi:hypothetical protein TSOC_000871 [Tetrabaena socialis]|uniref:Uncharacterized protein n=1 Tax=Tetrabaena socialis TaxID=47790 RepID=A0A2J8AI95_9CHLO|nr:hypothetical protein TSOC_000871 [Tetrabaena socialis]|eukprot:PNH12240.1 hypothetical protein TSOC_000871 [Tetrabaena socialis]